MTPETAASLITVVTSWVAHTENLRGLALLGSWARGEPTDTSDLDLLVLAARPRSYFGDRPPLAGIGLSAAGYQIVSRRRVRHGVVTSQVLTLDPPAEVELAFTGPEWADSARVDAGTIAVVRSGFRILVDKDGLLRGAAQAIAG